MLQAKLHRCSRLCLELLEARCLPSTVTNLSDHDPGSLRDAIATTPAGGTVDFQTGLAGTITLSTGEIDINKDLTIDGPGAEVATVSGNYASRVFDIANFTVAISGLTIADGFADMGGGILNSGTLAITNATMRGNAGAAGPAIYNTTGTIAISACTFSRNMGEGSGGIENQLGTLNVVGSSFSENRGNGWGGGIQNDYGTVSLNDCTFNGNSEPAENGGGVCNASGTMAVIHCIFSRNFAAAGGGISNFGTMFVTESTLSGNSGGGIDNLGTLTLIDSSISGNTADGGGGGIFGYYGMLFIADCTFTSNSATELVGIPSSGGGIWDEGPVSICDCTFSGNSAEDNGGGIRIDLGPAVIRNTIVAANRAPLGGPDVSGRVNSLGHNLIGNGSGGSGYAATDLVGTAAGPIDPMLGPLQRNGGPTQTMALLPGSPAIGAGGPSDSEWDQRGPGYPRSLNGSTDIGAFEVQPSGAGSSAFAIHVHGSTLLVAIVPVSGACMPSIPLRQSVAALDRVFACWTGWPFRHIAPAEADFRAIDTFGVIAWAWRWQFPLAGLRMKE